MGVVFTLALLVVLSLILDIVLMFRAAVKKDWGTVLFLSIGAFCCLCAFGLIGQLLNTL